VSLVAAMLFGQAALQPKVEPGESPPRNTLFFDGVCNLCDGAVHFIYDRDSKGRVQFGAIQKHKDKLVSAGAGVFAEGGEEALSTLVFVQGATVHVKSAAAVRIAALLDHPWCYLAGPLFLVPLPLRDWAYDWVAQHRYQLFGTADACRAPDPRLKSRFLEESDGDETAPPWFLPASEWQPQSSAATYIDEL
jgi:predicted DCC family thiol-disulfide oxidoreductase YuxK